jgi:hypothetical protein
MNETLASPLTGDAAARKGDWMITSRGQRFYPLDPRPEEIDILDIAHHLARVCRYDGAIDGWYSVAEHCCLLADYFAGSWWARWALLHDAAEAYIGDLIRPIKPSLPEFKAIEATLERMIFDRFGLAGPFPGAVKLADDLIVQDERLALFPPAVLERAGWEAKDRRLGVKVRQWSHDVAEQGFLERFERLFPEVPW